MFSSFVMGASSSSAASSGSSASAMLTLVLPFVAIFAIMYFFMIRPQRKKEKEAQHMRENISVGDNVTTVGGIVGRVVSVKDDGVVIETGADRNKLLLKKWAIQSVQTLHDD